jgi:polar amino acid transport system permease protein
MPEAKSLWLSLAWGDTGYGDEFFWGLCNTVFISVCGYAIALVIGLFGAWAKLCHVKALNRIGDVYTTVVRSVPELLLIILLYFAGTALITRLLVALRLADKTVDLDANGTVIVALALIYGAYLTDVLRGGFQAVPKGQIEAARAFGMRPHLRFLRILFPQAIRIAIPAMGNQWLNITKDSALVSVVGATELVSVGRSVANSTREFTFYFGITGLIFLGLTICSLGVLGQIEKRVSRGVRRA